MCPRVLTRAARDKQKTVKVCLVTIDDSPVGDAASLAAMVDLKRLLATDTDAKGVRLDLAITLPSGRELWIDFAGVHPTASSIPAGVSRWCSNMRAGETVAAGVAANNPMARIPSPAVSATENRKQKTYALMVDLGAIQARKRRLRAPEFFPAVVSHDGELSPGMIKIIEVLTHEVSLQH